MKQRKILSYYKFKQNMINDDFIKFIQYLKKIG